VKNFPIKKRINTELFIDGKKGLYKQKVRRDWIRRIKQWQTSEKRVAKNGAKVKQWE